MDGCSGNSDCEIVLRNRVSRPCSSQFDLRHGDLRPQHPGGGRN
jgi:hypothetical protein